MAEIWAELEKIGPFNAGRQREKILELLGQWYPRVSAFEAKLKPYDQQIRQIEAEKAALTQEMEAAVYALDRKRREEEEELIYELREVQNFLDSIPPEVLEELKANYQAQQQELEL